VFLMIAILAGVRWNLNVVLIPQKCQSVYDESERVIQQKLGYCSLAVNIK
jgi:hypothetical protein